MVSAGTTTYEAARLPVLAHAMPPAGKPIRVLIVQTQRLVADALEALLSRQPGMEVVGNLGTTAGSARLAAELNPDVVILDFRMSDEMAIAATRAIGQADTEAKVIFLTSDERDTVILAAIDAGASAVLYMSMTTAEVVQTVRTVAGGGSLISPHTIATMLNGRRKTDGLRVRLTSREREVLGLMAGGASNRGIAARLGISYVTVRCHVRNLAGKLAAHSQLEVLVRAQELDLVEPRSAIMAALS